MSGRGIGSPVLQGNAVVVGDFEGYLHWLAQDDGHFVALLQLQPVGLVVGDPALGVRFLSPAAFAPLWSGNLLLLAPLAGD